MDIHSGHRARMKARFLKSGLDGFEDHTVLELLLYFALPRGDTNSTAHELIRRFGSLAAVFDAPVEELEKVQGVGANAAALIKLIPQVSRRYLISKSAIDRILNNSQSAGEFLAPWFYAARDEMVYMVCLDAKCKVLNCRLMFRGSVNSAGVSVRKIVENALRYNATSVIIAHNHTSGIALPSQEDKDTTKRIERALETVDVALSDHIIVAEDDWVSLADSGFIGVPNP